jgi:hypothetical protein
MTCINSALAIRNKKGGIAGVTAALGLVTIVAMSGSASAQMAQSPAQSQQGVPPAPQGSQTFQPAPQVRSPHFSARTIKAAGHAMRDIRKINQKYTPQMQIAQRTKDQKQMQEINQKAQHAAMRKLSADGITPQKYQKVMNAAQTDRGLRMQLLQAAGFIQNK